MLSVILCGIFTEVWTLLSFDLFMIILGSYVWELITNGGITVFLFFCSLSRNQEEECTYIEFLCS